MSWVKLSQDESSWVKSSQNGKEFLLFSLEIVMAHLYIKKLAIVISKQKPVDCPIESHCIVLHDDDDGNLIWTMDENIVLSPYDLSYPMLIHWCTLGFSRRFSTRKSLSLHSSMSMFAQKYLRKFKDTYFILQNKYLCIYEDSFGAKILSMSM